MQNKKRKIFSLSRIRLLNLKKRYDKFIFISSCDVLDDYIYFYMECIRRVQNVTLCIYFKLNYYVHDIVGVVIGSEENNNKKNDTKT